MYKKYQSNKTCHVGTSCCASVELTYFESSLPYGIEWQRVWNFSIRNQAGDDDV